MGYTLIDYFRAFHSLKQELNLSMSAQAVYFSILGEFNAARFPKQLSLSDRELQALAGLKSVATAHDAKRILKNHKLIDFTSKRGSKGYTEYQLSTEHLPNNSRTITEQEPNNETNSYIRAREDLKTLDIKTKDIKEEGAGVHESGITPEAESEGSDIFKVWAKETNNAWLNARQKYELLALSEDPKVGFAKVKAAIEQMADSRTYKNYTDFKEILEGKSTKSAMLKGGEKNERPARIDYGEEPDYSWIK